jgi:hypothetical protein
MQLETDPGLEAHRDEHKVFRYRVREEGLKVRGVTYHEGDVILLSGFAAYHEPFPRTGIELVSPDPVVQTEDPFTWEAQSASSVHVNFNRSLGINGEPCHAYVQYAGSQGIARVNIVFSCGEWFAESYLTLPDAVRMLAELDGAIAEMKLRMFRHPDFDEDGEDTPESGDLHIHMAGGSF